MPIAKGTAVGPYEIVGWLGAGGMGDVYRARDPRFAREVAIKLIAHDSSADSGRVNRFEQEARAAGQLSHPNILAVYDAGLHGDTPYIVSELLEGESLRQRLHSGALPPRKATDYARQTAIGLAAAHDKGIVHRDVKPDNLFITADGRIKILDFGIAKLTRPADEASSRTGVQTETAAGLVVGTASYMSPEQVRGEAVDARSDIFSVGTVLHEMLTGRAAFTRDTAMDTMSAILHEDPREPLPSNVPPALSRIVARCLEKTRDTRFQSARDLAFALEVLSDTGATAMPVAIAGRASGRWRSMVAGGIIAVALGATPAIWLTRSRTPITPDNPFTNARFSRFTDWEGTEGSAEISPDGKFVAFLADRAGEFDIWLSQVGTGRFVNLTADIPPLGSPNPLLRSFGFSGDGSEIWFGTTVDAGGSKELLPLTGGASRAFLSPGSAAPAWSPDGSRLAYFNNGRGDPLFIGDRSGSDAHQIPISPGDATPRLFDNGMHNHNPSWSLDGQWIYFIHGLDPTTVMDVWRVRSAGGTPERLTNQNAQLNFFAPLDARTLLYVARSEDQSGPWLWALDVETRTTRRVSSGLEQYTSVAASRDGRRIVASVSNPTATLSRVPLLDRVAVDADVEAYPLPTTRALAPQFAGASLFYLSASGMGDRLWRFENGRATEIGKDVDGALPDAPAVSRDGSRVALVASRQGRRRLIVMSGNGTNASTLAESIDVLGAAGLSSAAWSPDGAWIAVGGRDSQGPGLFKIQADSGVASRLVTGPALNPIWSPDGNLIVYSGPVVGGRATLLGISPDGTPSPVPEIRSRIGRSYRFLPDGSGLVHVPFTETQDFWLVDLRTGKMRRLTQLVDKDGMKTFDISPDGKYLVFDRSRENSNIYQIDLPQ
jgi:serine/threonine protein kinase/Tol biopolymer transport system component